MRFINLISGSTEILPEKMADSELDLAYVDILRGFALASLPHKRGDREQMSSLIPVQQ